MTQVQENSTEENSFTTQLGVMEGSIKKANRNLLIALTGLMLASVIAIMTICYNLIISTVTPIIHTNTVIFGNLLSSKLEYIVSLDIPLSDIRGIDDYIVHSIQDNKTIAHVVIKNVDETIIEQVNISGKSISNAKADFTIPIKKDGVVKGYLDIFLSISTFQQIISDLKYEIIILSIISLILAIDLLTSFISLRITDPLRAIFKRIKSAVDGDFKTRLQVSQNDEIGMLINSVNHSTRHINEKIVDTLYDAEDAYNAQIDQNNANKITMVMMGIQKKFLFSISEFSNTLQIHSVNTIKIPLLIFIMAQEITTAFLPLYFVELKSSLSIPNESAVGLTFVGFLLASLISMMYCNRFQAKYSIRTTFFLGAVICAAMLFAISKAQTIEQILLFRTINGFGYGFIFLASQIYIARISDHTNRAYNASVFSRTIYSAVFFCPVIGGVLAEQIGYRSVFSVAFGMCLLSMVTLFLLLENEKSKKLRPVDIHGKASKTTSSNKALFDFKKLFTFHHILAEYREIFSISLICAIPIKIIHLGFIAYLLPLVLFHLEFRAVEIGRVVMLFGLVFLVCAPITAKYVDKHKKPLQSLLIGSAISLIGALLCLWYNPALIMIAVVVFAIAQAILNPAILSIIPVLDKKAGSGQSPQLVIGQKLAFFRIVERIGTIVGILILSFIVGFGGYIWAFGFIFMMMLFSCFALYVNKKKYTLD